MQGGAEQICQTGNIRRLHFFWVFNIDVCIWKGWASVMFFKSDSLIEMSAVVSSIDFGLILLGLNSNFTTG